MTDLPRQVPGTYSQEDRDWQNAFGSKDSRSSQLLRQEALTELDKPMTTPSSAPTQLKLASEFLDKYFERINSRKDGFLTKGDLDSLIDNQSLKPQFRENFMLVERYFERIADLHKDKVLKANERLGISRKDLKTLIASDGYIKR